jgi:hypothetical protein
MKKYQVEVSITYKQVIDIEAENEVSAEFLAFYEFDFDKAYRTDSEFVTTLIEGETK